MKKVLLINGSPHENGCTNAALDEIITELEKGGVQSEKIWLGTKAVQDCIACGSCMKNGKCVFDDKVNEIVARMDEFGGMIVGSPVYYGGPNGRLTSFLDRFFYSVPGDKLAGKLAASVVSCRRAGATASFERLNQYFLMSNMHVVGSQYWNMVHGCIVEDVKRDEEGLQTMRVLAQNFVWLMKSIECGEENGIEKPTYERRVFTSFMD